MVVGNDDLGGAGVFVNSNFLDLGRRQRLHDEVGWFIGERNDVDLFATKFIDDHADASAASTDACADGIDVGIVRKNGDLGACSWFTSTGLDFDNAVGDFGNFEFEQSLDETWMRTARDDLRALCGLANLDDVGLDARTRFGTLVRNLFGLRHKRFDASEIEQRVTRIGLLDDAGNDVAFATRVFLVLHFAFGFTNALVHDLLHRLRSNTTPHLGRRGDIELFAFGDAVVVEGLRHHTNFAGVGIDDDPRIFLRIRQPLVSGFERVGECAKQRVDRDSLVDGKCLECLDEIRGVHHDWTFSSLGDAFDASFFDFVVFAAAFAGFTAFAPFLGPPGLGAGPQTNVVRAFSISPRLSVMLSPSGSSRAMVTVVSVEPVTVPAKRRPTG